MKKRLTVLFISIFLFSFTCLIEAQTVTNGDFESWTSGEPDGWTITPDGTDITYEQAVGLGVSGDALKLIAHSNGSSYDCLMENIVTDITAGHTYNVSTQVRSADDGIKIRYWDTRWFDSNDQQVGDDIDASVYSPATNDAWTAYDIPDMPVTAPAGAVKLRVNYRVYIQSGFTADVSYILVDDLTVTDVSASDTPPQIANVQLNNLPAEDEAATVTADVTDDNGLTLVELKYMVNGGNTNSVTMTNTSGDTYSGDIPASAYVDEDAVDYWVYAEDNASPTAQSSTSDVSHFLAGTTSITKVHSVDTDGVNTYKDYYARLRGISTVNDGTFSTSALDVNFQDSGAGIVLYKNGEGAFTFTLGNDYTVVGKIDQYNGKSEIIPDDVATDITDNGAGTVPSPAVLTITEILANPETYEGMLIKIADVTKQSGTWPAAGSDANITITDNGGADSLTMRIDKDTNIDESDEGSYPLTVTGILGQYDSSSPYTSGYQIIPRSTADLVWSPNSIHSERNNGFIAEFKLYANFPNPFNPSTTLRFDVPRNSDNMELAVYNVVGQKVKTLFSGTAAQGAYTAEWDGTNQNGQNVPSGVYFSVLKSASFNQTIKMMLLK